ANVDDFADYEMAGAPPVVWRRYYDSSQSHIDGPLGRGFRHEYQRTLSVAGDRLEYINQEGEIVEFPIPEPGGSVARDGFLLKDGGNGFYLLHETAKPSMEFRLDDSGRPARLLRLFGAGGYIQLDYDLNEILSGIRTSTGQQIRVATDWSGHITSLSLFESGSGAWQTIASYSYSEAGDLIAWRDALGFTASYVYDPAGRMVRKTDRLGYSYHYRYDEHGRCVHTSGDDGLYEVSLKYLPIDRCTIVSWADGGRFEYWYDENGVVNSIVDPYGGVRSFVTDEDDNVVEDVEPDGAVTKLLRNDWGGHTRRVDPLGYAAAPADVEPQPADPLEHQMAATPLEWEFGQLRRRLPAGVDSFDPELTGEIREAEPGGVREVLDAMGRAVERNDGFGRERFAYDSNGNIIGYEDRDGAVWRSEFKSWNLLGGWIDPLGNRTLYDYSIREEITRITDAGGSTSEYIYDHKDRLIEVRRHGVTRERYEYDAADNLICKYDGAGNVLFRVEPGTAGLIRELQFASGEVHAFEHNDQGRHTRTATQSLEVSFSWDGTLCTLDSRNGDAVKAEFRSGMLSRLSILERFATHYRSDGSALIVQDPAGAEHRFSRSRDGALRKELSNGSQEIVFYDSAGRCRFKLLARDATEQRWARRYTYSGEGDLIRVQDSRSGETSYEFDRSHRLAAERASSGVESVYAHDAAGNLLAKPGLHGVLLLEGNRIESANSERFEYNHRNHIARRSGASGNIEYRYDSSDALTQISGPGFEWNAKYDPLDRRVVSECNGSRREYLWYGDRLAAETLPDGTFRVYVYADEWALVPFLFVDYASAEADPVSGRRYFLYTNQAGAPVEVEEDNGAGAWSASIEPYGTAHIKPDSRIELNLRWPGHYFDPEIGLHYNRFRYYSPELGRYLQSDPAGQSGGVNLYAYSANPLVEVDLRGLAHGKQHKANRAAAKDRKALRESVKRLGKRQTMETGLKLSRRDAEAVVEATREADRMHHAGRHLADEGIIKADPKDAVRVANEAAPVAIEILTNPSASYLGRMSRGQQLQRTYIGRANGRTVGVVVAEQTLGDIVEGSIITIKVFD
ncbi:MAG: RHS repeat-associated core domain-containing protein, partial [Bryobacteraceae bacterium]